MTWTVDITQRSPDESHERLRLATLEVRARIEQAEEQSFVYGI